jgi:hypothetical protein
MISYNTPNISTLELKQTIQLKIQGLTQTLDFNASYRFQREAKFNPESNTLEVNWYVYNCTEPIQDNLASQLESRFDDLVSQEAYFAEYTPPFIDCPVISQVEPMQIGNETSYNLRLTFSTQEEVESIRQHLTAIYDAKERLFQDNGKEVVPSTLEALKSIACCSSEMASEEVTPKQNWSEL